MIQWHLVVHHIGVRFCGNFARFYSEFATMEIIIGVGNDCAFVAKTNIKDRTGMEE